MQAAPNIPVIHRAESIPPSGDYQFLYEQGLELISQYSGEQWNNYNLGDPGVTILQTLCYALTELGYKANLPIQDILTRPDGSINYQNRFIKPQNILPVNPVVLTDFKKVLLDEVVELKQVYFNLKANTKLSIFRPYLEFKPAYLADLKNVNKLEGLKDFKAHIFAKVQKILSSFQNIGTLFLPPIMLTDLPLLLSGEIQINDTVDPDEFVAMLIFQINNYLSPYPVFDSYETLLAQGLTNDQIFDGPLLSGGFLRNTTFKDKRKSISFQSLMGIINSIAGVDFVSNITVSPTTVSLINPLHRFVDKNQMSVSTSEAPYFNFTTFQNSINLEITQNERPVIISEHKVQYYLTKIRPKSQAKTDFDQFLPKGAIKQIEDYYSIQHHFPEIYELNTKQKKGDVSPSRSAKTKQLKAYLVLFEQIMANYLAQLSHIGDLFSFDSGRNMYQLAGPTYFFQDLYKVPGIQELLKGVKGYARQIEDQNDYKDWQAYQRDNLNPYRQELMAAIEAPDTNLIRKNKILRHLLARFGEQYQAMYLNYNNPKYGDEQTAEVVHISETLKSFPILSANRSRSYFFDGGSEGIMYSGFELIAGNQLNLNSTYQGYYESQFPPLNLDPEYTAIYYQFEGLLYKIYGTDEEISLLNPPDGYLQIFQDKKLWRAFAINDKSLDKAVQEGAFPFDQDEICRILERILSLYKPALLRLMEQTKGFVFIDNLRFFDGYAFKLDFGEISTGISVADIYLNNLAELQEVLAWFRKPMVSYEDFILDNPAIYRIWEESFDDDEEESKTAYELLMFLQKDGLLDIELSICNKDSPIIGLYQPIPLQFVENRVSAVFPDWVPTMKDDQYKAFLGDKLRSILPMNVQLDMYYIKEGDMSNLLELFKQWMEKFQTEEPAQEEAYEILKLLKKNI